MANGEKVISETVLNYFTDRDVAVVQLALLESLEKRESIFSQELYAICKDKLSNPELPQPQFSGALSMNAAAGRLVGFYGVRGRFGGWHRNKDIELDVAALKALVAAPETKAPSTPPGRGRGVRQEVKTVIKVVEKPVSNGIDPTEVAALRNDVIRLQNLLDAAIARGDNCEAILKAKENIFKAAETKPAVIEVPRGERCFLWIGTDRYAIPKSENLVKGLITYVLDGAEAEPGNIFVGDGKYVVPDVALLERFLAWLDGTPKPIV